MNTERFDVAVVGAGPAGSMTARFLAQAGMRVALLDRAGFPRDKLCGGFVSSETLALLGPPELTLGSPVDRFAFSTPSERMVQTPLPGARPSLGVTRRVFDAWLVDRATAAGAILLTGLDVGSIDAAPPDPRSHGPSPVTIHARRVRADPGAGSGPEMKVSANLLVAADGRFSKIARLVGAASSKPSRASRRFGFQALFEAPSMAVRSVEIHFFRGGYVGLNPVGAGIMNACGIADPEQMSPAHSVFHPVSGTGSRVSRLTLETVLETACRGNPVLASRFSGARRVGEWHTVGGLSFGPKTPSAGGILFVGDAAGTIEPFTGEGIAIAIASARLACRAILEGLGAGASGTRGNAIEAISRAYAERWTRAFASRMRWCQTLAGWAEHRLLLEGAAHLMRGRPSFASSLVSLTRTNPEIAVL